MIDALKESHIRQPSEQPYNFSVPETEVATGGQYGQPWYLDSVIFKEKVKNGFFIGKIYIKPVETFLNILSKLYFYFDEYFIHTRSGSKQFSILKH